jgi:Glycosyl transferase family 2
VTGVHQGRACGSVVIPAHDEARVIGRCLDALFLGVPPGELEVVVACNGCQDDTADVARASGHPVTVLELAEPSKPGALRAADAVAGRFPRIYLDADVVLPGMSARMVLQRLAEGDVLAARPAIRYETSGSTAAVRRYYRARSRVPSLMGSLWGAGVFALSAAGRQRFGEFPDVVAEDLFVDQHFTPEEIAIVPCDPVVITTPRAVPDLVQVLRRTYRGNAENHRTTPAGAQASTTGTTVQSLVRLARSGVADAVDVAVYAGVVASARGLRLVSTGGAWERDDSSREVAS